MVVVTVIADRMKVVGMTPDPGVTAAEIEDALKKAWPADHHLTAYAPVELQREGREGTVLVRARMQPRAQAPFDPNRDKTIYNVEGAALRMVALIGDCDDPVAHQAQSPAREEWRAEVEPRVQATGLAWYRTKGGLRVLGLLDEPFIIDTPERATEWSARYLGWCEIMLREYGVELDTACKDATRVFRLPNVVRDGKPVSSEVWGALTVVSLPAPASPADAGQGASAYAQEPATCRPGDPYHDAAAYAILGALGRWEQHQGHKWDICGALGGLLRKVPGWTRESCAELIRVWLPPDVPGVKVEPAVAWACKAWDRLPEEVSGRRALEQHVGIEVAAIIEYEAMLPSRMRRAVREEVPEPTLPSPPTDDSLIECATLKEVDVDALPPPLRYVIPGLDLAPGKVSAIQGFACTAKTPFALMLSICVAAGVPFLGLDTVQCPVAYLDHEAAPLTHERMYRIRKGLKIDRKLPLHYFHTEKFSDVLLDDMRYVIKARNIGMLVHDTYSSALPADAGGFNDSSFRLWADTLGKLSTELDVLVVVLMHELKNPGDGGLRAISGHGSLAGALQASIQLSRPDETDRKLIRVTCARATRDEFKPFDVRWIDEPCEGCPEGKSITAQRIELSAEDLAPKRKQGTKQKAVDEARTMVQAGEAIMRDIQPGTFTIRKECVAISGASARTAAAALERLVKAGLLAYNSGAYSKTAAGSKAGQTAIAMALGQVAGFTKG